MCNVKSLALTAAIAALSIAVAPANAQAPLLFTGGSGTPLSITLAAPITYNIIGNSASGAQTFFVFVGTGDLFGFTFPGVTGTITYSINGGPATTIDSISSGFTGGVTNATDSYIFNNFGSGVLTGDTVTLFAGTLTTNSSIGAAAPTNGVYSTFIADGNGNDISTASSATAPEPGTLALLAVGAVGFVARRRKSN